MADAVSLVEPHLLPRKPRPDTMSPYGTKLATQTVILFCSVVVWGSVLDHAKYTSNWDGHIIYAVLVGLVSSLYLSVVLLLNYLAKTGTLTRTRNTFSHRLEMQLMILLVIWWAAGIGAVASVYEVNQETGAAVGVTSGMGVVAGWIAFFGSAFATYKAHHARQADEEYWTAANFGGSVSDEEEQVPLGENVVTGV